MKNKDDTMKEGMRKAIARIKEDANKEGNRTTVSNFKREDLRGRSDADELDAGIEGLTANEDEVLGLEPEGTPPGPGFTLNDVFQVLRRKYLALLAGAVVGLALVAAVLNNTAPIYAVSARVVLIRQDPGELVNTDSGSSTFIATQAEVMSSLGVVEKAVATLPRPDHLEPDADAVADAHAAIHASAISNTRVIALGYLGPDGEYGAALLRAMVDAYASELRDAARTGQANALNAKTAELDTLLKEIANQEAQIAELRATNNIIGTADEAAAAQTEQLRGLNDELTKVRNRRMELESRLASGGGAGQIVSDRNRSSLQEDLRLAEAELSRVSRTLTAEHPTVMAARNNVEILREQLAASDKVALVDQVAEAVRYETELTAQVSQARAQLEAIESHRRTENELLTKLTQNRSQADTCRQELSELRLGAQLAEEGNVGVTARFTDIPVAPEDPVWPRPNLMLPAGLILGLIGGFFFGLVSLLRDRRVRSEVSNP
jgi:uncharacterized protein involved in exopolysaccharide biosynthesis